MVSQKIAELKEEIETIESLKKELADLKELSQLGEVNETLISNLKQKIEREEFRVLLSGTYDKNNAILEIFSGAGGVDAQDWATMLLRMYERYCTKRRFTAHVLHQSFGEGGGPDGRIGTKSVTLEVQGPYAYGFLKKETGVHRLVRISPFNSQKLRHTSFALVEVLPEIEEAESDIEIKSEDLKLETFKSSGPGGQYVNKTESAVRITHIPTNIVVQCQNDRSQHKNKSTAMKILRSRLYELEQVKQKEKMEGIQGEKKEIGWGNQIRSYVLHPYRLVKDWRKKVERGNADAVLDGEIDSFIEAFLLKGAA